jgi:5-methylcytosine-specific restriction endonuclease McrA
MVPPDDASSTHPAPVNCRRTADGPGGGLEGLGRALLLNASFEPLCVVPMRRAVVLVLKDKAEIIARNGGELHSERATLPIPAVIRLVHFVRVPFRNRVPLSRRAVFARDRHRCQYCNHSAENIDHVVPRSRGGEHTWDNVVASCRACNARKEDRLPQECGLSLRRSPRAPHASLWLIATVGSIDPLWEPYLPNGEHAVVA